MLIPRVVTRVPVALFVEASKAGILLSDCVWRVPLSRPQTREALNDSRRSAVDGAEVGGVLAHIGTPGHRLRSPALVDVSEAVEARLGLGNRREQLLASSALLGGCHVEDASGWAVGDDDVGARADAEVVAFATPVLESPVGLDRWGEGAGVYGEAGSVGQVEVVGTLVEKDDALGFACVDVVEKSSGVAKITVLLAHERRVDVEDSVRFCHLLVHRGVEGKVMVAGNDKFEGGIDGLEEAEGGVVFGDFGPVRSDRRSGSPRRRRRLGSWEAYLLIGVGIGNDQEPRLDVCHGVWVRASLWMWWERGWSGGGYRRMLCLVDSWCF